MERSTDNGQGRVRYVSLPVVLLCVAVLVGLIVIGRLFVLQTGSIMSDSMSPTMRKGDRTLAVSSLVTRNRYKRGDIVKFMDPRGTGEELVKRVIAFPGERFEIIEGEVYINEKRLDEKYIAEPLNIPALPPPYIVPEGRVVVLGDNRNYSDDSIVWGPLPISNITGKIVYLLWPLARSKPL
jgi:signal peptidase I